MIHKGIKDLKGTKLVKHIQQAERAGLHLRPTCSSRQRSYEGWLISQSVNKPKEPRHYGWYDLGVWNKPDFVWSDAYNDRYAVYETNQTWGDKRFFYITTKNKKSNSILQAYLNSTIIPLLIEIDGITNLGEGAIYTNVYWLQKLLVPKAENIKGDIVKAVKDLGKREIRSIFEEIGANTSLEVYVSKVLSDRRALDKIVMSEILGLNEDEQLEVYQAVVDLIKARLEKAKSVGKGKRTKEGVDIDALVRVIMEKIGGKTLGTFFKSEIAPQKPLTTKTLPRNAEEVRIVQELFDWYLYFGNKKVKCGTELEARYLKVWAEASVEQVKVPKNEKAMKNLVPKLEKLKASIDLIVQSHLNSIMDRKIRTKIAHFVWAELVK